MSEKKKVTTMKGLSVVRREEENAARALNKEGRKEVLAGNWTDVGKMGAAEQEAKKNAENLRKVGATYGYK